MQLSDKRRRLFKSLWFGNPMSWRFFPEGNSGDDDARDQAIKEAEEAERKKQEEFDKARQRADQEAANAQKARQQAAQAEQQLVELRTQNEQMQKALDELKSKADDQGIELKEEDYEDSDVPLVKAIKALDAKIAARDKKIADLEKTRVDLLAERQATKTQNERNAVFNDLLTDLDGEYGAQHRNAAIKKFNELIDSGEVKPSNPAKATRALEKCYKDAVKEAKEKAKNNPNDLSLDPGAGGGSPALTRPKLKPGSLEEVSAQILAASKS